MNNNTIAMQLKLSTNKRKPPPTCAHFAKPTHTLGNITPYFTRMPQTLRTMFIITKTPRISSSLPTIWSTSIPSKHTLHSQHLTPKPQQSQKNLHSHFQSPCTLNFQPPSPTNHTTLCCLTFNPHGLSTLNHLYIELFIYKKIKK